MSSVISLNVAKEVKEILLRQGIQKLYPPQEMALEKKVLDGVNLVVSAPTASGKTLIAVLTTLKHVLEGEGKVLYLTPLRALAAEKYDEFKAYADLGVKVVLTTGDYDSSDPWLSRYNVIVTTNEKADSLLRHRPSWLDTVSLLIADEIHLINDGDRGPTLEMVISRTRRLKPHIQILALSATIKNTLELSKWLNAEVVSSEWRPVPLREGVYFDKNIFFDDESGGSVPGIRDPITDLVLSSLREKGQVLVFASTRRNAVGFARRLADPVKKEMGKKSLEEVSKLSKRILTVEKNKITELLARLIRRGVAFHHAGLSHRVRKLIEDAFRKNTVKVISATPTLAAGVNLPARRVVVTSHRRYDVELGYFKGIPVMEYKQMAGRAGRPQYDDYGQAILLARSLSEKDMLLEEYVKAEPERIFSKLASEPVLRSQVLASIASGYSDTSEELLELIKGTLYALQFPVSGIKRILKRTLDFLAKHSFIIVEDSYLTATNLGRRVSQLYIDPYSAVIMITGMKRKPAASPLGYLHLISATPDMSKLYLRRREEEVYSQLALQHIEDILLKIPRENFEFFLAELKTSLLLKDWMDEKTDDYMIDRYRVGPGDIYGLTQTAEWLLYSCLQLSKELSLSKHFKSLSTLQNRMRHGVKEELLDLVRIRGIGRVRARILFEHGFKSLGDLEKASTADLAKLPLMGTTIAESVKTYLERRRRRGETKIDRDLISRGEDTLDRYLQ